jgi:hypothetical protein
VEGVHSESLGLRDQVDDAIARLEEHNNGYTVEPFPEITTVVLDRSSDPSTAEIENPTDNDGPVSATDEEKDKVEDDDDDDEDAEDIVARRGIREEAELPKNGLPPVWTSWGGYPGVVPEEISEYLDDGGGHRKYYPSTFNSRNELFH